MEVSLESIVEAITMVKSISIQELNERREGICLWCGEEEIAGHKCREQRSFTLQVLDDDRGLLFLVDVELEGSNNRDILEGDVSDALGFKNDQQEDRPIPLPMKEWGKTLKEDDIDEEGRVDKKVLTASKGSQQTQLKLSTNLRDAKQTKRRKKKKKPIKPWNLFG